MQPRNIEVFDGLRITTDHFDHLQGAIHSALQDFRGILGLARVHRGFGVTAADEHSVQVDPGLAFDAQRRRIVSDEPVKLEVPAAISNAPQFVCVSYDQGADGEVEGHFTRIWDSAHLDIRAAPPSLTDDAIVIAVLEPTETGEGFTIRMGGVTEAEEEKPPPAELEAEPVAPPATEPQVSKVAVRSGVFVLPDAAVDRAVLARMATAIRDAASGTRVVFSERLASHEALAGVVIESLSIDAAVRLASRPAEGDAAAGTPWRIESAGHGQVHVADDGTLTQFGAGTSSSSWGYGCASFAPNALLTLRTDTSTAGEQTPRETWLAGLRLTLRCAARNNDGFAVDAALEWEGPGSEAIAAWLEAWTGSLQWLAEGGWSATGSTLPPPTTPGG